VLIICDLFNSHALFVYKKKLCIKRACELNKSHIISTDEDPGLRIESFAVINLRGVSTNKTIICQLLENTERTHFNVLCKVETNKE
jgi:hypothetical protein